MDSFDFDALPVAKPRTWSEVRAIIEAAPIHASGFYRECPWLERNEIIGASDAPRLLGLDPHVKSAKAIDQFIAREKTPRNAFMEAGQFLEPGVMAWASKLNGVAMRAWQTRLVSASEPWISATPDGETEYGDLVEVKCCGQTQAAIAWKSGPPQKVLAQVQLQLFVTGRKRAHVVQWNWSDYPKTYEVRRDDVVIDALLRRLRSVWEEVLVRRGDTPDDRINHKIAV